MKKKKKLTAHCSIGVLYVVAGKSLIAINGDPKLADEQNNCYKSIITSSIPHLEHHSRRIELYFAQYLVETPFTNATRVFYLVISPSIRTMHKATTKQSLNVSEMEVGW